MLNKKAILVLSLFFSSYALADVCVRPLHGFSEKYLALVEVAKFESVVPTGYGDIDIAAMVSKALLNPYSGFSIGEVRAQGGRGQVLVNGKVQELCFLKSFTFELNGNTRAIQAAWKCEAEQSAEGNEFKSKITKISCQLTAG